MRAQYVYGRSVDSPHMEEIVRDTLGPKWALKILSLLGEESPLNYTEIETQLPTSSDVVTDRLRTLSEVGLLNRTEKNPQNVQYALTDDGKEVLRLIREIDTHLDDPDSAS